MSVTVTEKCRPIDNYYKIKYWYKRFEIKLQC